MGVLLEEVVLYLPRVVDPVSIGELHLVEGLVKEPGFIALRPGARQLVLVEDSEFHGEFLREKAR